MAFECAGVEATVSAALEHVNKGGAVVQVALYAKPPRAELSLLPEHEKSLIGSMMYKREDYVRAIELIASRQVVAEPLISRHFDFDDYVSAYECIDGERDNVMKIMIDL